MELEDVLEEYLYHCMAKGYSNKTMINKRQEYKQIKQFLKEKRGISELESITTYDLKAYIREKQKAGLQPQSIVSMWKMVAAFFNWCEREGYLKESIIKKVDIPKVPKKVLKGFTVKDVQEMIDAFSFRNYIETRNKAIIAMLADCGLRAMEIRGLQSVNVKDTTILVNGKGNKERIVFISPALKRILIKYERIKKQYFKEKIIQNNYFLTYTGTGISHVGLDNVIKEAGKRASITGKRVSPHSFRHFFSVQSLTAGIDVYSLSRLLGHGDISVTQRYLQSLSDDQLLEKAISSSPLMNISR
ncbi:recombinase [Peribacillus saganii]|uniref:Recombinase n=1 Tax=Peribacillus saganii TaxID=2303992 RepID=A0A372LQ39_9BACI|nr:tyrosine-type recombinase/integrase [Peribacillus saganii]RFU70318.1 recombinase [Peribacillus saganii]